MTKDFLFSYTIAAYISVLNLSFLNYYLFMPYSVQICGCATSCRTGMENLITNIKPEWNMNYVNYT